MSRWLNQGAWVVRLGVVSLSVFVMACAAHAQTGVDVALPGEEVATLDATHIPYPGAPHAPYSSVPPTSGAHVPQTVAPGIYRDALAEELQVHALEHGHILIQYAPGTPRAQVRVLETIARRYPRDVVVAPYGKLEAGIAVTAWGRIARFAHADVDAIVAFVKAFRGRYNHGWRR